MSLKIKQLIGDKVLIEPAPAETKTASGIYIPETAQEKPQIGTVVAVGPGRVADLTGTLINMTVVIGDKVQYNKFAAHETQVDGKNYLIIDRKSVV